MSEEIRKMGISVEEIIDSIMGTSEKESQKTSYRWSRI